MAQAIHSQCSAAAAHSPTADSRVMAFTQMLCLLDKQNGAYPHSQKKSIPNEASKSVCAFLILLFLGEISPQSTIYSVGFV